MVDGAPGSSPVRRRRINIVVYNITIPSRTAIVNEQKEGIGPVAAAKELSAPRAGPGQLMMVSNLVYLSLLCSFTVSRRKANSLSKSLRTSIGSPNSSVAQSPSL